MEGASFLPFCKYLALKYRWSEIKFLKPLWKIRPLA